METLLGQGGMGSVYLAYDMRLDRKVAIKFLKPELAKEETLRRRFIREAQSMAKIEHPHVIKIYGVEEGVECPYLIEEYIDGSDLDNLVAMEKPFNITRAKDIFVKIVSAVAELHEKKLVHRDIKPLNVLIDKKKEPHLLDFGLILDKNRTALTEDGAVIGTVYYMPPEVLVGNKSTPSSDVFQLGLLLNFIVTGEILLIEKESDGNLDLSSLFVRDREIPTPSEDLPSSIRDVIIRCCQKDPKDRFKTAGLLLEYLNGQWFGKGGSLEATVLESSPNRTVNEDSSKTTSVTKSYKVVGLLLLGLLLLGFFIRPSNVEYSLADLVINQGYSSITLSWHSETAYKAKAKAKAIAEENGQGKIVSEDAIETKEHEIVLGNLEQDSKYRVWVVFPNGKQSMPQTVKTDPFEFTLDNVAKEKNAVRISGHCSAINSKCTFSLMTMDGVYAMRETMTSDSGRFSISLSQIPKGLTDLDYRIGTNQMIEGRLSQVGTSFSSLQLQLNGLLKQSVQGAMANKVVADLHKRSLQQKLKKRRGEKITLEASAIRRCQALSLISPLLLDTKIYSIEKRLELISLLRTLQLLHICAVKNRPDSGFTEMPSLGKFTLAKNSAIEKPERISLKPKSAVIVPLFRKGQSWSFELRNVESVNFAEVELKVEPYRNQAALLTINDLALNQYDGPHLQRTHDEPLYQPIPPYVLKNGNNELTVKPIWLAKTFSLTSRIEIRSIEILLGH